MKKISVFGYSGSGKTFLIEKLIYTLKSEYDKNSIVIKNIHEHTIDKPGKDTMKFGKAGAECAVTKNSMGETTIFYKRDISHEKLIEWLAKGPFSYDVVIFESFRDLDEESILCVKHKEEIEGQLNKHVKIISGLIAEKKMENREINGRPVLSSKRNIQQIIQLLSLN